MTTPLLPADPRDAARKAALDAIDALTARLVAERLSLADRVAGSVEAACVDEDDQDADEIAERVMDREHGRLLDTALGEALDEVLGDAAKAWASFGR